MGCDIHLHQEVKINGKWLHYSNPSIDRNYRLFAILAGVRNHYEITPINSPRGIPEDIAESTKFDCDEVWGCDGHSHSHITAEEIAILKKEYEKNCYPQEKLHSFWFERIFGFLYGNSWDGFTEYPEDRPKGLQDIRFVFWFDN